MCETNGLGMSIVTVAEVEKETRWPHGSRKDAGAELGCSASLRSENSEVKETLSDFELVLTRVFSQSHIDGHIFKTSERVPHVVYRP